MDLLRKYYKEGYAKLQGDPLVDILIEIFLCVVLIELAFVLYSVSKLLDAVTKYYTKKAEILGKTEDCPAV